MSKREEPSAVDHQLLHHDVGKPRVLAHPVGPAVDGDEDPEVGSDVERVRTRGMHDHGVHGYVRQRQVDASPGGTSVDGLEDVSDWVPKLNVEYVA